MTQPQQDEIIPLQDYTHKPAVSQSVQGATNTYRNSSSTEAGTSRNSTVQLVNYHHRDFLARPFNGEDRNDTYLSPYTGRLRSLVVQSEKGVLNSESGAVWFRSGIRNRSPWMIRISNWAMSRDHGSVDGVGTDVGTASLRWLPACFGLAMVTSLPIQVAATPSNFGRYDSFLYKDWRYPLDARNKSENKIGRQEASQKQSAVVRVDRVFGPTYLCFIDANSKVTRSKVSEWTATPANYVFVSFTGSHGLDRDYLRDVGRHAAHAIGVSAYWISNSCLADVHEPDKEKKKLEMEQAIWTIADIVRRASAVAIAVPGPLDAECNGDSLYEWGNRAWTMPELLLYTGKHPISIYENAKTLDQRRLIPRREIWDKVWNDTAYSGQLIDHYENSLTLSPLELVTVALQCLHGREIGKYLPGDMSYVLMGLLRQRPDVVRSDTAFQAFARLSLANDSNMLLERMICFSPRSLNDNWSSLDDAWNAMLWDIYPRVQICGIGENDTVILDGARGAAIRWDKFVPVLTLGQESMRHKLSRWILRIIPAIFVIGLSWVIIARSLGGSLSRPPSEGLSVDNIPLIVGIVLLILSSVVVLLAPYLIRLTYCTKIHDSQPFFFGIEGYLDIYRLELLIFGSYEGRLQWSTASSPLSRHDLDRKGVEKDFFQADNQRRGEIGPLIATENMYTGLDPVETDTKIKDLVKNAKSSSRLEKKIFTLIDTYTMTVTLFEAVRPPVAVVLCGAEGGMQRALLCSHDWTSGTLYRETVLRMETRVRDRMDTLARVRLGLKRNDSRDEIGDPRDFVVQKAVWWKRFAYRLAG